MNKKEQLYKLFEEGRKDFEKIAEETGAKINTVKTQWYKFRKIQNN